MFFKHCFLWGTHCSENTGAFEFSSLNAKVCKWLCNVHRELHRKNEWKQVSTFTISISSSSASFHKMQPQSLSLVLHVKIVSLKVDLFILLHLKLRSASGEIFDQTELPKNPKWKNNLLLHNPICNQYHQEHLFLIIRQQYYSSEKITTTINQTEVMKIVV